MEVIGLLEAAPDAVVVVDTDGAVTDLNARTVEVFGHDRDVLLGKPIEMLLPERYREKHAKQVQTYIADPQVRPMGVNLELFGLRADGQEFPVEISLSPLRTAEELLIVAAIRDITDRKGIEAELRKAKDHLEAEVAERTFKLAQSHEALKREHDRARRILDVAGVMMVSIGADERVQLINPAGAKTLGLPASEIIGKNWFDHFLPDAIREPTRKVFHDLLAGRVDPIHRHENPVLCADGSTRLISWHNTVLVEEGGAIASLSSGADVTDYRDAERALRETENLAQLGKMAAVMAHEIKNPLAAVTGALDVVRGELVEGSTERGILDDVIARLGGLAATVKDLLDFARPAAAEPVDVPLASLIDSTVHFLHQDPAMSDLEVVVDAGEPCVVRGDVQQLNRLLCNLLLNAGQAMNGKGRVEVRIEPEEEGFCQVSICDRGPGIPENERERVLEPFYTTKIHGTGLGLPTSRRIVESHGGRMQITCPEEGGTCIRLWLACDGGGTAGPASR